MPGSRCSEALFSELTIVAELKQSCLFEVKGFLFSQKTENRRPKIARCTQCALGSLRVVRSQAGLRLFWKRRVGQGLPETC